MKNIILFVIMATFFVGCSYKRPTNGYGSLPNGGDRWVVGKFKDLKLDGLGYYWQGNEYVEEKQERIIGNFKNGQIDDGLSISYEYRKVSYMSLNQSTDDIKSISYFKNGKEFGYFLKNRYPKNDSFEKEGIQFTNGRLYIDIRNYDLAYIELDQYLNRKIEKDFYSFEDYKVKKNNSKYKECFDGTKAWYENKTYLYTSNIEEDKSSSKVIGYYQCNFKDWKDSKKYKTDYYGGKSYYKYNNKLYAGFMSHLNINDLPKKNPTYIKPINEGLTFEYHPNGTVISSFYDKGIKEGYALEYKKFKTYKVDSLKKSNPKSPLALEKFIKFALRASYSGALRQREDPWVFSQKEINEYEDILKEYNNKKEIVFETKQEVVDKKVLKEFLKKDIFSLKENQKKELLDIYDIDPVTTSRVYRILSTINGYQHIHDLYQIPKQNVSLVNYKKGKEVSRKFIPLLVDCTIDSKEYYVPQGECGTKKYSLIVEKKGHRYFINYDMTKKSGIKMSTYLFYDEAYGIQKGNTIKGVKVTREKASYKKQDALRKGTFINGMQTGKGEIIYAFRNAYLGMLSNNKKHGKGKTVALYNKEGDSGNYNHGVKDGKFTNIERNKKTIEIYKNGILNGEFKTYVDNKYVETWNYVEGKRQNKKGKCTHANYYLAPYFVEECEYKDQKRVDSIYKDRQARQAKQRLEENKRARMEKERAEKRRMKKRAQEKEKRAEKKRIKKERRQARLDNQRIKEERSSANKSSYMRDMQNKLDQNAKFYGNNSSYTNKSTAYSNSSSSGSSYKKSSSYSKSPSLSANKYEKKVNVNYFTGSGKTIPKGEMPIGVKFTSVYEYQKRFTKECLRRYSSQKNISRECATQANKKATSTFMNNYGHLINTKNKVKTKSGSSNSSRIYGK